MEIIVTNDNDEDLFSEPIATAKDFGYLVAKGFVDRMKANPMKCVKGLKDAGILDDLQYKQAIINIRKNDAEKDFEE